MSKFCQSSELHGQAGALEAKASGQPSAQPGALTAGSACKGRLGRGFPGSVSNVWLPVDERGMAESIF